MWIIPVHSTGLSPDHRVGPLPVEDQSVTLNCKFKMVLSLGIFHKRNSIGLEVEDYWALALFLLTLYFTMAVAEL